MSSAMQRWRSTVLWLAVALLAACSAKQPVPPDPATPTLVTLEVGGTDTGNWQSWDGVVEAVKQAVISAQTGGRVSEMSVDVNDQVAAGAVLLRLTAFEQQADADTVRAQLKSAEAVLLEAESRFRRSTELVDLRLVSRAEFDQNRAARDSAAAARDAVKAQLQHALQQAAYTVIRAPYAGVVSARHVEPGEVVAPGQPLLTYYAPGALRIEVQVPQSEVAAIRDSARARLFLADGRRIDAGAVTVFPSADPIAHTVPVRVQLPAMQNPPQPGMTVRVLFPASHASPELRVPATAIVQRGEVSGVYVVKGASLDLRQIRIGERVGDYVTVIAGLAAGERIAADPIAATQLLTVRHALLGKPHG